VVSDGGNQPVNVGSADVGGAVHGNTLPQPFDRSPARRAEIERIRTTDIDRYFAEGLDKELLSYIREDLGADNALDFLDHRESRQQLSESKAGRKLVLDWERSGGFQTRLAFVQKSVAGLVSSLGDEREQRAFMERFDRSVPEEIRYLIFDLIADNLSGGYVTPATPAEIKAFEESGSPSPEIVKEWGSEAPERLARIWRKIEYMKLTRADLSPIFEWLNAIPDAHYKAVLNFVSR
jgi:hypothetical protein